MSMPATVQDVVARLRELVPGVTGKKLQKLLYYAQAWSLVWDQQKLFADRFEAWRDGPVVRDVYADDHHGVNAYRPAPAGDPARLGPEQLETIEAVVNFYGQKSGDWLSRLTHREPPWRAAREGLTSMQKSQNEISTLAIAAFYSSAKWGEGKNFSDEYTRGLEMIVSMPEEEVMALGATVALDVDEHIRWLESGEEP